MNNKNHPHELKEVPQSMLNKAHETSARTNRNVGYIMLAIAIVILLLGHKVGGVIFAGFGFLAFWQNWKDSRNIKALRDPDVYKPMSLDEWRRRNGITGNTKFIAIKAESVVMIDHPDDDGIVAFQIFYPGQEHVVTYQLNRRTNEVHGEYPGAGEIAFFDNIPVKELDYLKYLRIYILEHGTIEQEAEATQG